MIHHELTSCKHAVGGGGEVGLGGCWREKCRIYGLPEKHDIYANNFQ